MVIAVQNGLVPLLQCKNFVCLPISEGGLKFSPFSSDLVAASLNLLAVRLKNLLQSQIHTRRFVCAVEIKIPALFLIMVNHRRNCFLCFLSISIKLAQSSLNALLSLFAPEDLRNHLSTQPDEAANI